MDLLNNTFTSFADIAIGDAVVMLINTQTHTLTILHHGTYRGIAQFKTFLW